MLFTLFLASIQTLGKLTRGASMWDDARNNTINGFALLVAFQDSSGAWVTPAFQLHLSRLDALSPGSTPLLSLRQPRF